MQNKRDEGMVMGIAPQRRGGRSRMRDRQL